MAGFIAWLAFLHGLHGLHGWNFCMAGVFAGFVWLAFCIAGVSLLYEYLTDDPFNFNDFSIG